jgi:hypothetical protein
MMAGAGMAVILAGGKRGLRPGGKAAVFNADGECPGCCQCEPFVLGSFTTNRYYNPCWDLTPYQGPGQAPPGSYWRLIEIGMCYPYSYPWYGAGCVNSEGRLVGLPSQFCSNYYYDGYMELQIGCYDPTDNRIHWPGTCQPLSTRYSC